MTYPNRYLYLTAHWTVAGAPPETGQFGLKFDSTAAATQALAQAAYGPIQTLWTNAIALIDFDFKLQYVRLAQIDVDGKYVPGTIAYDYAGAGSVPGGGSAGAPLYKFPLQVASVTSLQTAFARGQAHRGRIYLPPIDASLGSNYRIPPAWTAQRSNAVATALSALNAVMPGPVSVFSKGTKAAPTVGAKHVVTSVVTGDKLDVQRRRAGQQPETMSTVWNVT